MPGLYYEPGSNKAVLCRRGVGLLEEFCEQRGIRRIACGKVLVALDEVERARLDSIESGHRPTVCPAFASSAPRTAGAGATCTGYRRPALAVHVDRELRRGDPGARRRRGRRRREDLLGYEVVGIRASSTEVVVTARSAGGSTEAVFDRIVVCGGLQSDRLAELAGDDPEPAIMPFRGEYYALKPERRGLVNGLVYPVPDPRYPFLGVHVTPRVDGEVLIGPNAVLALAREGYTWGKFSVPDVMEVARTPAFWRFARRHWRTGISEMRGSLSKRRFIAAAGPTCPSSATTTSSPGGGHPCPGAGFRRRPCRRLPNQHPRPRRPAPQRALACGHVFARHRRAHRDDHGQRNVIR